MQSPILPGLKVISCNAWWKGLPIQLHLPLSSKNCLGRCPTIWPFNLHVLIAKHIPVGRTTLAKKKTKIVPIKSSSDKRTITAMFAISLQGDFLPMQLIYGGNTRKCLPWFKFPAKFSLSCNETHYSNEKEACKFIEEILQPYIKKVIERENLPVDQKSLVIMDLLVRWHQWY